MRTDRLLAALEERVLCLDGATGTWLQDRDLGPADFGGPEFEGCNENLVLLRPNLVLELHRAYLEAGADIVETNTFGATPLVLGEYPPLQDQAYELNRRAAELARQACTEFDSENALRFVAGSMGPTTKALSVTGGITFDELIEHFKLQAQGLLDGGADYLLLETCQDTLNIKAGLLAIEAIGRERDLRIPIAISGTIEPMGTMLAGQPAEALAISVAHVDLLYIGLNCATGPEFMTDPIRALSEMARTRVACVPNAGLPDEDGNYLETPLMMASVLERFLEQGWLNVVGGCCGTTPAHIKALRALCTDATPRPVPRHRRALYSGIDWLESTESNRPLLVGERSNVIGSRKFKRLIREERFEEASEIARAQVKKGAHIIDVCLANPDRDELEDTERFLDEVVKKVKVPLMIDSTDAAVIERALTYCQGKSIINSINLEDGEERFQQVVPLARRFGAALVVGCIDEDPDQGMGVTRERKLAIAERSVRLLVEKYGVAIEDLIFDPLVFPCATGDENYLGSAKETIEGIRLIKAAFPEARTILGISNVSFGLPPAGREVLNSVFLYECTRAGLDMAIVNTEKLERYASIPEEERALAENLLLRTNDEAVAAFADHFRGANSRIVVERSTLSLDERLAHCVVEGTKEGLLDDLNTKLETAAPLDIINGPLMTGMDEVGRLFNTNQLIVAEVLQSAEVMKAAVGHLEPLMETSKGGGKGCILLATVKGDVHDIGKNLVDIILSNNGYRVVNLGIKIAPQAIIEAVREHEPDIVGLSGLLVKSAQMMVITAEEMSHRGVVPDLLVGGAALTPNFTRKRIAPAYDGRVLYARDAMDGLALANALLDPKRREETLEERAPIGATEGSVSDNKKQRTRPVRAAELPAPLDRIPQPPDSDRHILRDIPLDEIWPWINPKMLFNRHLGFQGDFNAKLKSGDPQAEKIASCLEELRSDARTGRLTGQAVWRWFEAETESDDLLLFEAGGAEPLVRWTLPRRPGGLPGIPGYIQSAQAGGRDWLALFVVSASGPVRAWAEELKENGAYLKSHSLLALALEAAEGLAEWLHARLRGQWGFPDSPDLGMNERFKARYQGIRYSPGYPACPDLALQDGFWKALQPQDIGVSLTEGHMMEPEASVSAMVLHHPEAKYFAAE